MGGVFFRGCFYEGCMEVIVVWEGCVRWGGRVGGGGCVWVGGWVR